MANMTADERIDALSADVNHFWLLFGTVLVFFMQTGFAMLTVGCCQIKNTKNILLKNVCDAAYGAICWYFIGWGIAMGPKDGNEFYASGEDTEYLGDFGDDSKSMWLFQWAFAATAATIVSGAVAERITLTAYSTYAIILTSIVYPVVVFWGWGAGFASAWREEDLLNDCGVIDFAGSGVVHMTGGIAAFWGALIVGARIGKFERNARGRIIKVNDLPQQSVANQTLGTLILWVGWYGFNGCSTLAITGYGTVAAHAMTTTTLAAATGGLATMLTGKIHKHYIDMEFANNGVLAGLVGITAGCATSTELSAIVIGAVASQVYYWGAILVEHVLHVDDVVKATPVHFLCGVWGVLAAGLFADEKLYAAAYYADRADKCKGLFQGEGGSFSAAVQFVLAVLLWVSACSIVLFSVLRITGLLRVPREIEDIGMDDSKHGGAVFGTEASKEPPRQPTLNLAPTSKKQPGRI